MSEFTETKEKRLLKLKEVSRLLLDTGNAHSFVVANKDFIPTVVPSDFITLFDELIKEGRDLTDIKLLSNKVLNIFHTTLTEYQSITYVDEHDKVRYFSTPQKRIFPRTNSLLGREVRNCHPPESVHVV